MKSVTITYFVHGTTTDNESGIATGWAPGKLSKLGIEQSIELRRFLKNKKFDVVFSSDLKRAVDYAKLTFGNSIIRDKRLRECDYGDLEGAKSEKIDSVKHITKPFPNGESYKDVEKRMKSFLKDLLKMHASKKISVVAHRAPQLALDVIIKGKSWKQAITEDWRLRGHKGWKPGWNYKLEG